MIKEKIINTLVSKYDRNEVEIVFNHPHFHQRENIRNLDIDKVIESIRKGKIDYKKSRYPNTVFFNKYYGKENTTYIVCVIIYRNFWEAKTAWKKSGRI